MVSTCEQSPALLVFWHLQKTGGTSLTNHLFSSFQQSYSKTPFLNDYQKLLAEEEGRTYWLDCSIEDKIKACIASGHEASKSVFSDLAMIKDIHYITMLREPSHRLVSYYNHDCFKGNDVSFDRYLREMKGVCSWTYTFCQNFLSWGEEKCNTIFDEHSYEAISSEIINELKAFSFIGFHDNYSADTKVITDYLGISPVMGRDLKTGEMIQCVHSWHDGFDIECRDRFRVDYIVYDYFYNMRHSENRFDRIKL